MHAPEGGSRGIMGPLRLVAAMAVAAQMAGAQEALLPPVQMQMRRQPYAAFDAPAAPILPPARLDAADAPAGEARAPVVEFPRPAAAAAAPPPWTMDEGPIPSGAEPAAEEVRPTPLQLALRRNTRTAPGPAAGNGGVAPPPPPPPPAAENATLPAMVDAQLPDISDPAASTAAGPPGEPLPAVVKTNDEDQLDSNIDLESSFASAFPGIDFAGSRQPTRVDAEDAPPPPPDAIGTSATVGGSMPDPSSLEDAVSAGAARFGNMMDVVDGAEPPELPNWTNGPADPPTPSSLVPPGGELSKAQYDAIAAWNANRAMQQYRAAAGMSRISPGHAMVLMAQAKAHQDEAEKAKALAGGAPSG